jgi:hypothetical protein
MSPLTRTPFVKQAALAKYYASDMAERFKQYPGAHHCEESARWQLMVRMKRKEFRS